MAVGNQRVIQMRALGYCIEAVGGPGNDNDRYRSLVTDLEAVLARVLLDPESSLCYADALYLLNLRRMFPHLLFAFAGSPAQGWTVELGDSDPQFDDGADEATIAEFLELGTALIPDLQKCLRGEFAGSPEDVDPIAWLTAAGLRPVPLKNGTPADGPAVRHLPLLANHPAQRLADGNGSRLGPDGGVQTLDVVVWSVPSRGGCFLEVAAAHERQRPLRVECAAGVSVDTATRLAFRLLVEWARPGRCEGWCAYPAWPETHDGLRMLASPASVTFNALVADPAWVANIARRRDTALFG